MDAALKLRRSEEDDSFARTGEEPLPVPPWVLRLANRRLREDVRIGPALINLLAYVAGTAAQRGADSIVTSVPALMAAFPHVGERTVKRWVEDLRAPIHDDQVRATKYLRLGLLECNKTELEGDFRLTPLRPPDDGPRPATVRSGPQRRMFGEPQAPPQDFAQSPAERPPQAPPQDFAQSPAERPPQAPPQDFAQSPAVVEALLTALEKLAGPDRYNDWLAPPTEWTIEGTTVAARVPGAPSNPIAQYPYILGFRKLIRSVIGPACRHAFPDGEVFELRLGISQTPASQDGGKDRPQDFAQSPAVPFKVKLSSLYSPTGNIKNELQVQACAPRILARAAAIAARFRAPSHFFGWHWVQAAWGVETGRVPAENLESCIDYCLTRSSPHWQFSRSIVTCFGKTAVRWLDPRKAEQRALLVAQLANCGLPWNEDWERGQPKPR